MHRKCTLDGYACKQLDVWKKALMNLIKWIRSILFALNEFLHWRGFRIRFNFCHPKNVTLTRWLNVGNRFSWLFSIPIAFDFFVVSRIFNVIRVFWLNWRFWFGCVRVLVTVTIFFVFTVCTIGVLITPFFSFNTLTVITFEFARCAFFRWSSSISTCCSVCAVIV